MSLRTWWASYRQHHAEERRSRAETRRQVRAAVLRTRVQVIQATFRGATEIPYSVYDQYRKAREELAALECEQDGAP